MEKRNNIKNYKKTKLHKKQELKKRNKKEDLYLMISIKIIYHIIQYLLNIILSQFKRRAIFLLRINIFLFLFFPTLTQESLFNNRLLQEPQKIIIKVLNPGEQEVINSDFVSQVTVFINDEEVNLDSNNKIDVPEGVNEITLQFGSTMTYIEKMFSGLSNVVEIDFTHFDCSRVNRLKNLFEDCSNLEKITFSNSFGAIDSMYRTFYNCNKLTSIDLSVFDTSGVSDMQQLFKGCNSLTFLDLSNFVTSEVYSMEYMFSDCSSLTSLVISNNFNTEKVTSMKNMFSGCQLQKFHKF